LDDKKVYPAFKKNALPVKMGRPISINGSSFPIEILEAIKNYRVAHTGWGAKTIRVELLSSERFASYKLPSVATIANYLRHLGLVKAYEPNRPLANTHLFNLTTSPINNGKLMIWDQKTMKV
jgi:hypothetical protein